MHRSLRSGRWAMSPLFRAVRATVWAGSLVAGAQVAGAQVGGAGGEALAAWPSWRGPGGDGVASASANPPLTWGPEKNIRWRVAMPSWGGGSPVVGGGVVYVTSAGPVSSEVSEAYRRQREEEFARDEASGRRTPALFRTTRHPGGDELLLLAVSQGDGRVLWTREIGSGNGLHLKSNDASPSAVTDGSRVWAVSGVGVVAAFDRDGTELWRRDLQAMYGRFGHNWGYASSPILHDGKLIVEVLHGFRTDEPSYVAAFDAGTGEEVWRVERPTDAPREAPDAYTTPLIVTSGGRTDLVISGADYVTGHDPKTGSELWRAGGLNPQKAANYRVVGSPLFAGGLIIAPTRVRPMLALRPGGVGDVSGSHLAWSFTGRAGPDVPTPVSDGERLYLVNDQGLATALDLETGAEVWGPERTAQGTVSGSPVLAGGRVYFTNESGVTVVLRAGPAFEVLAQNELDGSYTLSSPAVAGDELFIRTAEYLYCIAEGAN